MKNLLLFSALLIYPALSFAQNTFVKGYVVTDKGDTLKGEVRINPKKENELYSKVFLKDASGMQKNYKPEKTRGYGYDDKHFVSIDSDGEVKYYQVLVSGPVSLLRSGFESMKMNEVIFDTEYYMLKKDENKLIVVKESRFKKQVAEVMKDNAGIAASYPEEKKFDPEKAAELITKYNSWKSGN